MSSGAWATLITGVVAIAGFIGFLIGRMDRWKDKKQHATDRRVDAVVAHGEREIRKEGNEKLDDIAGSVADLGPVELDILPRIQQDPKRDFEWCRYIVAVVKNTGRKPALIRAAHIATGGSPLPAFWVEATPGEEMPLGFNPDDPLVFTLQPSKSCIILFAERRDGEIVAPDYRFAPWGHVETACEIVISCVSGKYASMANEPLRAFANWVSGYRNKPRPPNSPGYFAMGGNMSPGR